jgi:hypothetical protein
MAYKLKHYNKGNPEAIMVRFSERPPRLELRSVLRDDGMSYMQYVEQITLLLFLKMAERTDRTPRNRPPIVPPELGGNR